MNEDPVPRIHDHGRLQICVTGCKPCEQQDEDISQSKGHSP